MVKALVFFLGRGMRYVPKKIILGVMEKWFVEWKPRGEAKRCLEAYCTIWVNDASRLRGMERGG